MDQPPGYGNPGGQAVMQQPPPGNPGGQAVMQQPPPGNPGGQAVMQQPPPGYAMGQQANPVYEMQQPTNYGMQAQMPPAPPGAPVVQVQLPRPEPIPGVPPGLEYLNAVDQILVHQQLELLEILSGWETSNRYIIKNSVGQQVYFAAEESGLCMRQCCGPNRGFTLHITDNFGSEVIRVTRPFKCCAGASCCACLDWCAFEVTVESPLGSIIGYVRQECSFLKPALAILDAHHEPILRITGPICQFQCICCPRDLPFQILNPDKTAEVGVINKQWGGVLREMVGDADMFGIKFPGDLDVRVKATCLAAVFLIDFMFFETKQN